METREKYGAETVFCSTGGGGNPEFPSISRFCNAFGTPNWFEPGCAQCYLPRTAAFGLMYGVPMGYDTSIADSNCPEIYFPENSAISTLVLWGTDPSYSCPSGGGRTLVELRARGVRTVVVDPRLTPDAARADVWLPIRPGTDVALMLAWIRYILEQKLYDEEFVMKWTNLPYLVDVKTQMMLRAEGTGQGEGEGSKETFMVWDTVTQSARPITYPWDDSLVPALEGTYTVNGVECKTGYQLLKEQADPFTLEHAAEICWLDSAQIEKAIRLYALNPTGGVSLGVATDQAANSMQAAMGAAILNALTGNVEKPGALLQRFKAAGVASGGGIVPDVRNLLSEEQLNKRLGGIEYKVLLQWWAAHPPAVLNAILTGKPYKPWVWIERSGNKLATLGNSSSWLPAIEQLDFIVHMYMYPTSFSAYADILLPAVEWLETDIPVECLNMIFARQAVTHTWETMDETLFWSKLARRCADRGHENCQKAFDAKYTEGSLPYWNTMEEILDASVTSLKMTWKEFKEKAPIEFMPEKKWREYYVYKQIDPKTGKPNGFGTGCQKVELYAECLITLGRTGAPFSTYPLPPASKDYPPLPYYVEPAESPLAGSTVAKEFPLVMTNGRIPFFHHTTLRNIPWLREIYPVPQLWINPDTAGDYGIKQDDWVWVESQRGKTQAKAYVTAGIGPGVVYMERFWNPETLNSDTHGWREMNVNLLSKNDPPYADMVGTYTLRGYQVKVSRADGPPKGIWQKPEDFKPWLPEPSDPTKAVEV